MKATGVVRTVDSVGRFVIPMEIRKTMNINVNDSLEVFVDEDTILLRKYNPSCIFCKSLDDIIEFEGQKICKSCITKIHEISTKEDE